MMLEGITLLSSRFIGQRDITELVNRAVLRKAKYFCRSGVLRLASAQRFDSGQTGVQGWLGAMR